MSEFKYKFYGKVQYAYHAIKGRNKKKSYGIVFMYQYDDVLSLDTTCKLNGQPYKTNDLFFKGDNIIEGYKELTSHNKQIPIKNNLSDKNVEEQWLCCICKAKVEEGWKNSGFYLTAYTQETKQWCLSNWIWTSAAIARVLSKCELKNAAKEVADTFLKEQLPEGGWIVRYDFIDGNLNRLAAPNDSAYIARNALLTVYRDTFQTKYLDGAEKCAKWIINTSCNDSLVWFGYNVDKKEWIKNRNIVDIGFTASLFAELYAITRKEIYKEYLERFINTFVNTFYDNSVCLFASHINGDRKQNGGYFSRGQAWAMEGIISAYSVLGDDRLFQILEKMSEVVVKNQLDNGGWYCNFQKSRSLMGEDCKGISAIANSLLDWAVYSHHKELLIDSAKKALAWCESHTDPETGMILSFTCNGAIAHSPNTSTGILYANAYAIETKQKLKKFEVGNA